MTTIGIIGAGEVGSHIARAAIANGYEVVLANSRGPETLMDLIAELGPSARAATASGAAAAGAFVVVAVPLKLINDMPVDELAGKVVIDTNNYMAWRDGHYPVVDAGEKTEHELRQEQLPSSKVVKAFTHIQAPRIITWGTPADSADRPGFVRLKQLSRGRGTGSATVRPVRFRHRRQQPAQRVLA